MLYRNKIFSTVAIILFIVAVGASFIMISKNNGGNQSIAIKTDKETIIKRFPNIGNFQKCYWKADTISKGLSVLVPGPSGYWMKGFIEVDKEQIKSFIDKYIMVESDSAPQLDFVPEDFDIKESRWYYSDNFNEYIKPPGFLGEVYIDGVNQVIYFDVRK